MNFLQTLCVAFCCALLVFSETALLGAESTVPVHAQPTKLATKTAKEKVTKMKLEKKEIGGIQPLHAFGDIYLAGHPTPEDLLLLKQEGVKTIITLCKRDEIPWDESVAVTQLDMKFFQVPFQSPAELKPEVFDQVLKVLRDKKRGPTVLHCASSNRVGAIWFAYRVLDGKLSPEAALEESKTVGLRTPAYLEVAQTYVQKVQSEAAENRDSIQDPKGN